MSTFFSDIAGALRTRLNSLPGAPPIAWENINYTPSSKTLYLRATMLPIPTIQASLGDDGKDLHEGIFQVDVFIPDGQGRSTWPDAIADHFKRGTVLTQNSVTVRIKNASIGTAFKEENFYQVPVTIDYQSFTSSRTV